MCEGVTSRDCICMGELCGVITISYTAHRMEDTHMCTVITLESP